MSVVDGQAANATTFNTAFQSKTSDNTVTGVQTLSAPGSGASIPDLQQAVNDNTADISGKLDAADFPAEFDSNLATKDTDDLSEGATNLYHTDGRAQSAVITQVITNGVTDKSPSEDAVFNALALKAPLASPALTGTPTAPTQAPLDSSTKIATTEYVDDAVALVAGGGGDVDGPASSVDSEVALFDGVTGKLIKSATGTGFAKLTSGVLSASASVNAATELSGITPVANGGTNSSTALSGSSIVISDGTSIVQGAAGTTSTVLHGNASGAPTYGAVALATEVSGTLPIANGGTNSNTALSGSSIMISDGTKVVQGAAGTTTTVLHGNASGAPTYGAVSLTADVSGNLPVGNLNSGTNASASTVWSGDGTWKPVVYSEAPISGTDIDWSVAPSRYKTLSANTTFTFSNIGAGQTIVVHITNTASNYTVTWPTVEWTNGTTPTQTIGAKTDVYTFSRSNGVTRGAYSQNHS